MQSSIIRWPIKILKSNSRTAIHLYLQSKPFHTVRQIKRTLVFRLPFCLATEVLFQKISTERKYRRGALRQNRKKNYLIAWTMRTSCKPVEYHNWQLQLQVDSWSHISGRKHTIQTIEQNNNIGLNTRSKYEAYFTWISQKQLGFT